MPSAFTSPVRLLLLVVVVGLAVAYVALQLRRHLTERAWADPAMHASLVTARPGPLRHAGPLLLLAALAAMTAGFAGPVDEVEVQRERALVVLALDTSASMLAEDVAPDRFTAAKQAATGFVEGLPEGFDVALVSFAGTASVVVPATEDSDRVTRAIADLELAGGTALGDALLSAVAAASVRPDGVPATVVMLADGGSTAGTPVERGVAAALDGELPVHTIAYGTPEGVVVSDGRVFEVPVDEAALAEIAEQTDGRAYTAATAGELDEVYDTIRGAISTVVEEQDVSARFAGVGLALLAAAAVPVVLRSRLG